jgi:hypothetical protein
MVVFTRWRYSLRFGRIEVTRGGKELQPSIDSFTDDWFLLPALIPENDRWERLFIWIISAAGRPTVAFSVCLRFCYLGCS